MIIENELFKKECALLKNLIALFSLHDNKFSRFKDMNNKQIILFNKNHQIFQPSCQAIESFKLMNQTLKCYEDIPIIFNYTSPDGQLTREINGFLTLNGIIKNFGNEILCNQERIYMKLDNSNVSIRKLNNTYKIFHNLSYPQLNVHMKSYEPMLEHNEILVNGVDYMEQMAGLNKIVEIEGSFNVLQPILPNNDKQHFSLLRLISSIIIYGIIIIICLILLYLGYQLVKFIIYVRTKNAKNVEYNQVMETVKFVTKLCSRNRGRQCSRNLIITLS